MTRLPDLSIVIFRSLPKRGNANAFNEKLIVKIMNHGRIFMSSTLIYGKFMLRLAVLSFRTHLEKVDEAITIVEEMIDQVKKEF